MKAHNFIKGNTESTLGGVGGLRFGYNGIQPPSRQVLERGLAIGTAKARSDLIKEFILVDSLFDSLTISALDFLETAVSQLEAKPKYSVINFCSGIELLLKARLLKEHWTLIVSGRPNRAAFLSGTSTTISITEAIKLLEDVAQFRINNNAKECFQEISAHRNRNIHFFPTHDENTTQSIVSQQCKGWFYLYPLLTSVGPH